jgi:hypothetical protein
MSCGKESAVNDCQCPWCEAAIELAAESDQQQCPECLSTWCYEDAEVELALAA